MAAELKKVSPRLRYVSSRSYIEMADQLEEAFKCYDGVLKSKLTKQVAALKNIIKKEGLQSEPSQLALTGVKCTLGSINVERDLRANAPKAWSKKELEAHIKAMMDLLS